MKMKSIRLSAVALPMLLSVGNTSDVQAQEKKNVLMILNDDMGAMELGCYGSTINNTPNLDELAESGTRFQTFYATPVSSPTRVGLMTGKYGHKTGWLNMRGRDAAAPPRDADLALEEYTFGQMFHDAGYRTAFAGKWQLTGNLPSMVGEAGFDEYLIWIYKGYLQEGVEYKGGFNPRVPEKKKVSRFWHPGVAKNGKHLDTEPTDYGPDMFSDFIVDFMKQSVEDDRPFFAYYPMVLMHKPWLRTPDHPDIEGINTDEAKKANVEYSDKIMGKLMDAIRELGIEENTLVIFVGDNGTQGIGKSTVTEWGVRTPCIVSCPGTVQSGVVSEQLVELCDLLPTMLDFSDIRVRNEQELDGLSLMPLLKGEQEQLDREYITSFYGQFRIIREENWLLERNSQDGFGDLYYTGDIRNGLGYRLVEDYTHPQVQKAMVRMMDHLEEVPLPDVNREYREDFSDFVGKKKDHLVRQLEKLYGEDYGHSSELSY